MTRITTSEVCALGRFSRATLWRRIKAGTLPGPVDHSREAIFDRDRILAALSIPSRGRRWRARPATASSIALSAAASQRGQTEGRWSAQRWEFS